MIGIVLAYRMILTTTMTKKSHSKKVKLDHEPVGDIAETPRKIYQEALWKADALPPTRNGVPKELAEQLP